MFRNVVLIVVASTFVATANAKDKSNDYQVAVFQVANVVHDGTTTNSIKCGDPGVFSGNTVCGGGVHENTITVYHVKVEGGHWDLETRRAVDDAAMRRIFHDDSQHLRGEVDPLVGVHAGDKVIFRIGAKRQYNADIFIPLPNNPNKETKFMGWFHPDSEAPEPKPQTDNVKAMCDSHKLSQELEKKFCSQ
jgi:hypothetical protein